MFLKPPFNIIFTLGLSYACDLFRFFAQHFEYSVLLDTFQILAVFTAFHYHTLQAIPLRYIWALPPCSIRPGVTYISTGRQIQYISSHHLGKGTKLY
jgi:hypothetical protein